MSKLPRTALHVYQCRVCQTTATSASLHPYGEPLRCNLCFSYMKRLYSDPITTPEQLALAERGVVYNPAQPRQAPKRCEQPGCKHMVTRYGVELDGIGSFCSAECADAGVKRHEAALNHPPSHLLGTPSGD